MASMFTDRIGTWAVLFGGLLGGLAGLALLRLAQPDESERIARRLPSPAFYHDANTAARSGAVKNPSRPAPAQQAAGATSLPLPTNPQSSPSSNRSPGPGQPERPPASVPAKISNPQRRAAAANSLGGPPMRTEALTAFLPPGTPNMNALISPNIRPAPADAKNPAENVPEQKAVLPAAPPVPPLENPRGKLREAERLAAAGRWSAALAASDEVLKLAPHLDDVHLVRGRALAALKDDDAALAEYRRMAERRPDDPRPHLGMGDVAYDAGRWTEASEHYSQAIQLHPDALAYFNRGSSLLALERFDEAIEDFTRALQEKSAVEARAYANRGYARHRKGQIERALQDYDEAIRRAPNDALALCNRGGAYHALGRFERALQDYTAALQFQPADARAFADRGSTYLALGDFERAIRDYDAALHLDPRLKDAARGKAIAASRKDHLSAAKHLESGQAAILVPSHP